MYLAKMSEGSKTVVTDIGGLEWDHVRGAIFPFAFTEIKITNWSSWKFVHWRIRIRLRIAVVLFFVGWKISSIGVSRKREGGRIRGTKENVESCC